MPVGVQLQFGLAAATIAALFAGLRYETRRTAVRALLAVLVVEMIAVFAGLGETIASSIAIVAEIALLALWWSRSRASIRAWRAQAHGEPLHLSSPFLDRWRVAAGGPLPGRNHHLAASDQRFAYDFVRVGGASQGEPILAPCDGTVVTAVDGFEDRPPTLKADNHPDARGERAAGNHVVIETPRGFIFLCHLQHGSVAVAVGEAVTAGTPIGRCGNSGRTTGAHLHLHAQRQREFAPFSASGVPIAFVDRNGTPRVLGFGDVLAPEPGREPVSTASGL